jgi:asparagine synthase (glutamine-hydrolysing)
MDRPKWGFAIPIDTWFETELSDYFNQYLNKEYISQQNIFNFEEINSWLTRYKLGQKEYIVQLWCILMFQLWYEKWMK